MNKLIGISGFARSGKDTFYERCKLMLGLIKQESKRYSFADALKGELDELLIKYTGISAFTDKDDEKSIIRPLLVTYGTDIRRKLNPNCWIDSISSGVNLHLQQNNYVFITDVRFLNEAEWIKNQGGTVINIVREGIGPANHDEQEQYDLFKDLIDYTISWPTFGHNHLDSCDEVILHSNIFQNLDIEKIFQTTLNQ
jgi:hypothetical protein